MISIATVSGKSITIGMEAIPTAYTHADEALWPTLALHNRSRELSELMKIPHGAERTVQLEHEFGCVNFELLARYGKFTVAAYERDFERSAA